MEQRTDKFLLDASLLYQEKSPELSRFFSQLLLLRGNAQPNKKFSNLLQSTSVCPYCCQWLMPDNHRVRLWPKQRPSAQMQSILRRKARGKRLNLVQRSLLFRFQKSSSKLMATCHACSKTTTHKGMNREFIASFAKTHTTPGSAGKHKTPQSSSRSNMSTPKTPGKDKTPTNTPRSSISSNVSGSSSTSSKSSKRKNWVVQRLSKILMREESESQKKGGLKDFLSSL